jgi:tetratricopeptide (TPR) repeat protein
MARQHKAKKIAPSARPQANSSDAVDSQTSAPSTRQVRREKAVALSETQKRERAILIGVMVITAFAYFNSLNGEFVYDDLFQILKNPSLASLTNIPKMFVQSVWQFMNASSQDAVGLYYRPIFNSILIINYQIFGQSVFGWHLVSLLLHLATTYLVYKIAAQWELPKEIALTAALFFGLHPVHSESVAWISALPDPLAAVFLLLSLLCYERYYRGKLWQASQKYLMILSLVFAFFAIFSKEVAVAFPIFLGLREFFDKQEEDSLTARIARSIQRAIPFYGLVVFYLIARYYALGFLSKSDPKTVGISTGQLLFTIPTILLQYVRMLFFPFHLSIIYAQEYLTTPSDPRFWASAIVLIAMFAFAYWVTRKSQIGRRSLIWLILFLLPVLNLKAFNPQESLIHDRYLYVPSIGFCILMAQGIYWLSKVFKAKQEVGFEIVVVLICIIFFGVTVSQNSTWKSDLDMANNALQYAPNRPFLFNYIGVHYFTNNNPVEAEKFYLKAIESNPAYYDSISNLGDIYRMQGKNAEAEQYYLKAIEYGAPYADTYYNLAVVYTAQGKLPDAERQLLVSLEKNPRSSAAQYNLGWVYDQQGKSALAEQAYAKTLEILPSYPEPRINLALLQTKRGALNEALNNLLTAQTYAPDHSVMLYALGDVYMRMNKYQDAIKTLMRLIQREPQHRLAYTMLGLCTEALGDKNQARTYFQKAIEVAPQEAYTNTAREHLQKL